MNCTLALIEIVPSWVPLVAVIVTWIVCGVAWVVADEIVIRRRKPQEG